MVNLWPILEIKNVIKKDSVYHQIRYRFMKSKFLKGYRIVTLCFSQAKQRGKPGVRSPAPAAKQDAANQTNKMQHQIQQPKQWVIARRSLYSSPYTCHPASVKLLLSTSGLLTSGFLTNGFQTNGPLTNDYNIFHNIWWPNFLGRTSDVE